MFYPVTGLQEEYISSLIWKMEGIAHLSKNTSDEILNCLIKSNQQFYH